MPLGETSSPQPHRCRFLAKFKWTKHCRLSSTSCWNRFQNFTHCSMLEAQPTLHLTCPATKSVYFPTRLLFHEQPMQSFPLRLESRDLSGLELNGCKQRYILHLHVVLIFLYFIHVLVGIVGGVEEVISHQKNRPNAPSWTSHLSEECCTRSVWDLRSDVVEDLICAKSRRAVRGASDNNRDTFSGDGDKLRLWTHDRKTIGSSILRVSRRLQTWAWSWPQARWRK